MSTFRGICFAIVLLGFALPSAHAAPGPGKREEIKEKIRAMRIARVVEQLDLDERGATRLAPILDRAYDQIAAVSTDSGEARRELKMLVLVQPPDDARLNHLIDRLLANKAKIEAIEAGMFIDVRKVLTASQAARLVVVLPEINHQIQQQIRNAVRPNRPGQPNEDPF
jgi:Spy/CpxP family protein refolding chaperone